MSARLVHDRDQGLAPPHVANLLLARRLLAELELRDRFFAADLLADPVWRLLLDLYVRQGEGKRTSVSSACIVARVPQTTALRLLHSLEGRGLIARKADCQDRRRTLVSLTAVAHEAIEAYLALLGEREARAAAGRH